MNLKKILDQLNISAQCKKHGLSLWQCPQFLFLIMGIIIIGSLIATYLIGTVYIEDPGIVALIVLVLCAILFIVAFVIAQSFDRLAEASRMKSEFISIASHQLRAPLSNLSWTIELLMSGRLGRIEEKQTEYFKILKENNDRMEELIKDLLVVSKIEAREFPLKKEEVSLVGIVKDLIFEFEPFIKASNIDLNFEIQPNLAKVFADPFQIKMVIENFIDNAIRYIPDRQSSEADKSTTGGQGKGRVEIKLEQKGKNLYFEIKDNGVGIPKKDQKYIFQKFFRSENIIKYQTQGSGLGLFIAKSIIEKSGGKIGFKSEENKGSTFWFTLPT